MTICSHALRLIKYPPIFERLLKRVFRDLPWTVCLVYLDDIIVHGSTLDGEFSRLCDVFQSVRLPRLKLNPRKRHMFQKQIRYLGDIVSEAGISVDPKKTEAVRKWPDFRNKTELRNFLGLCTYYRWFVHNFADVARLQHQTEEKIEFC